VLGSGGAGGKRVTGRKRHIVVATMGDLITARGHSARVNDGKAAPAVREQRVRTHDRIRRIWADRAYVGKALPAWVLERFQCVLEVVTKQAGTRGGKGLPRR